MDINFTLVVQGIAFFAVAWVVMKFGWPHIMAAIEQRQQQIAEGLAAADRARKELAQGEEKAAEELRLARGKANEIIEQAHARANQIVDQAREEAIAEAGRQKILAEAEIAASATCGEVSADCTPGTALACEAKPSMVDHGARRPDSFASANAARA